MNWEDFIGQFTVYSNKTYSIRKRVFLLLYIIMFVFFNSEEYIRYHSRFGYAKLRRNNKEEKAKV